MRGVGQHGLGLACHLTWVPRHSALLGFWVRCVGLANMAVVWRCHLTWVPRHSALLGIWVQGWPTWPWLGVPPHMGATSFHPAWVSGAGLANMAWVWHATSHGCHVILPCFE